MKENISFNESTGKFTLSNGSLRIQSEFQDVFNISHTILSKINLAELPNNIGIRFENNENHWVFNDPVIVISYFEFWVSGKILYLQVNERSKIGDWKSPNKMHLYYTAKTEYLHGRQKSHFDIIVNRETLDSEGFFLQYYMEIPNPVIKDVVKIVEKVISNISENVFLISSDPYLGEPE